MKLKQHREDVKFLQQLCDIKLPSIARRYLNLIRMAEESIQWHTSDEMDFELTSREDRVLKDTKV